jgi:hypothetical protein
LLKELYELEMPKKMAQVENGTKTFVNGFGEATTREITSATYTRADKRMQKDILAFIS